MKCAQHLAVGAAGSQRLRQADLGQITGRIEACNGAAPAAGKRICEHIENPGRQGRFPLAGGQKVIWQGQVALDFPQQRTLLPYPGLEEIYL